MESISIMRIELNGGGGEESIPVIQTDTDSDRESGVGRAPRGG